MRGYLARLLARSYRVEAVPDGREALEAARERRPDLVLSGVLMPRLDGMNLIRELRADSALQAIPVILLSARSGEGSEVEGMPPGADDYLSKPFSARDLLARVAAHLEMVRIRKHSADQVRHAQEALRASEERFRSMVESYAQAVWETDAAGAVVSDSPSWHAYTGQTFEERIGDGWVNAIHPDDRAYAERQWRAAVATGRDLNAEFRLKHVQGGWRWTNARATPIRAADGSILQWAGMNIDIEDRKRAEAALRESEARQAFLLKLSDALRPLGDPRAVQQEACRVLRERLHADRVTYTEITGPDEVEVVATDRIPDVPDQAGLRYRISDYGRELEAELRRGQITCRDSVPSDPGLCESAKAGYAALHIGSWAISPLVKNGQLIAMLSVHRSAPHEWTIHELELLEETAERTWAAAERARAEAALRQSEKQQRMLAGSFEVERSRLEAVLHNLPVGVWIADQHGQLVSKNEEADRIWRGDAPLVESREYGRYPAWDARSGEELRAEEYPLARALATARPVQPVELKIRRFDGTEGVVLVSAAPFVDREGRLLGAVAINLDITGRASIEAALHESEKRQAFLLKLSDTLRSISDPLEIQFEATRFLGEYLGAARVGYAESKDGGETLIISRHYTHGVPGVEGIHRLERYGAMLLGELLTGRTLVRDDVANDPGFTGSEKAALLALPVGAMVDVPLVKSGGLVAILFVHFRDAHAFAASDLSLMEAVAERTWAAVERARAEAALRTSELQLRTIGDNLPEAVLFRYCHDTAGNPYFEFISAGIEKLTGIPAAEFLAAASTIEQSILPEEHERLNAVLAVSRDRLSPAEIEVRRRHRITGEVRWSLLRSKPARTPDGGTVWDGIELDITERKRAEEALRESEHRYRVLHESLRDAFVRVALDGRIIECNDLYCQMLGYSREELRELSYQDLTPERWRAFEENIVRTQIVPRGYSDVYEKEYRRKDGTVIPVELRTILSRDAAGNPEAMWGIIRDISERKRDEERLRQAQKLESVGLLAGGVAHDFNNLLVGVLGYSSLAREMLVPDHPAFELLGGVIKTGEQLAHLTRQMLAYSGKGRFFVEMLDISAVVREISDLIRPSVPKKVTLRLELEEGLPPFQADRGQVQQVLMNLALNAAEAIGSRDGRITVRTRAQRVDNSYIRAHPEAAGLQPGSYIVLEVEDTGCGMDDSVKAKIFDPFFSTKFTGRGLGLAAVSGILRGHQGAIVVSSQPGIGSSFTVLFPAAARPAPGPLQTRPRAVTQGSGIVLVIDDEQVVRETARKTLERNGYAVLVAQSGPEAIDIFKRYPGRIDLAILDLNMPGMSGEETLPELRKIRPDLKVVVSSGYSEAEAMRLFEGQQVSGFIQKPYTAAVLAEKVKLASG